MIPRRGSRIPVLDECAVVVLLEGDLQFLLCVHYNRTVPCDRFIDGFSGHEEKADRIIFGRNDDLFPVTKQDKILVSRKRVPLDVEIVCPLDLVGERVFLLAEPCLALDDICEDRVPWFGRVNELRVCRDREIKVFRIGDDVLLRHDNGGPSSCVRPGDWPTTGTLPCGLFYPPSASPDG